MHIMQCPLCKVSSVAQGHKFVATDLSIRIACPACGKKPISAHWHCNCGIAWHSCPMHSAHCAAPKAVGRTRMHPRSAEKHSIIMDAAALLDDDLRRESKRARTSLDNAKCTSIDTIARDKSIPHRMFPPNLRERFPSVVQYLPNVQD